MHRSAQLSYLHTAMRFSSKLFFVLAIAFNAQAGADPFPVATSGDDIRKAFSAPDKWSKRMIGIGGLVQEVKQDPKGRSMIRVILPKPNEQNTAIWIGSLVTPEPSQLQVGDIIRVLGYLSEEPAAIGTSHDPPILLGICVVNQSKKIGLFSPAANEQCSAWQNGEQPSSLANKRR